MNLENNQLRSEYEGVPYLSSAIRQTFPDNLRTVAALAGFDSSDVASCRVLEIGCSVGRNLMPMAATLAGSSFVGIDFSPRQIDIGRDEIQQAGLANIELRCQNMLDFGPEQGQFDYIIAHGIYSWVPANVREKLLEICATNLAPRGVAYISYNTLPGYHLKNVLRDMMLFHARDEADPAGRVAKAREMIEFAGQSSPGWTTYFDVRAKEAKVRSTMPDWALLHDEMEPQNHPVYFRDFISQAARHGLGYLGDAEASCESFHYIPAAAQQMILRYAKDPIEILQYSDFLTGLTFRSSVLCHREAVPKLADPAAALTQIYIASNATRETVEGADGKPGMRLKSMTSHHHLTIGDPRIMPVFDQLKHAWPHPVPFNELLKTAIAAVPSTQPRDQVAASLAMLLLTGYKTGVVELWTRPIDFIAKNPAKPKVAPLARLQIKVGIEIVNLRHQLIPLHPAFHAMVLQMDGSRTRAQLVEELTRQIANGEAIADLIGKSTLANIAPATLLERLVSELSAYSLFRS